MPDGPENDPDSFKDISTKWVTASDLFMGLENWQRKTSLVVFSSVEENILTKNYFRFYYYKRTNSGKYIECYLLLCIHIIELQQLLARLNVFKMANFKYLYAFV